MLFKKNVNLQGRLVKRCKVFRTHPLLLTKVEVQILLLLQVESTLALAAKTSTNWATTKKKNSTRLTILTQKVSQRLLNGDRLLPPCPKMLSPKKQARRRRRKKAAVKNLKTQTFLLTQMKEIRKQWKKHVRKRLKNRLLHHYLNKFKWKNQQKLFKRMYSSLNNKIFLIFSTVCRRQHLSLFKPRKSPICLAVLT